MRLIYVLATLLLVVNLPAQGIEFFHGTWEEALVKAQQEDKPIFVDAYASWCGPCKQMASNVFPQPEVGEVFNANFINMKLDMEKPEAASFRVNHSVRAYPTLFFLDSKGETIHTVVGGQKPDGLISHARTAMSKVDDLSVYEAKYAAGEREPNFVFNYVRALVRQGQPHLKVANDQLREQSEQLNQPGNLRLMLLSATEADSRIFDMLLKHRTDVEQLVSKDAFDKQVSLAFENTKTKAVKFNDPKLLATAAKKYKSIDAAKATAFLVDGQYLLAATGSDAKAYLKAAKNYYKKAGTGNQVTLGKLFSEMSQSSFKDDAKVQDLTATIGQEAASMSEDYENYYRLAKWMNSVGKKKDALANAEKAKTLVPADKKNIHVLLDHLIEQIGK